MRASSYIARAILLVTGTGLFACNKVKNREHEIIQRLHRAALNRKDKIFPAFDATKPDTENNRKRFKELLGTELTDDVKNIYCDADRIGIDASYSFAFECNALTHQSIINHLQLHLASSTTALPFTNTGGFSTNYNWWDQKITTETKPYTKKQGDLRWYLWRDRIKSKDYFLTFDM